MWEEKLSAWTKKTQNRYMLILIDVSVCQIGNIDVNNAAKLECLSLRLKKILEYFLTSIQTKIRNKQAKLSKSISVGNNKNLFNKYKT